MQLVSVANLCAIKIRSMVNADIITNIYDIVMNRLYNISGQLVIDNIFCKHSLDEDIIWSNYIRVSLKDIKFVSMKSAKQSTLETFYTKLATCMKNTSNR